MSLARGDSHRWYILETFCTSKRRGSPAASAAAFLISVTGGEVTLISIRQTQRPHGEALAKFAAPQEKLESQPNQNLSERAHTGGRRCSVSDSSIKGRSSALFAGTGFGRDANFRLSETNLPKTSFNFARPREMNSRMVKTK